MKVYTIKLRKSGVYSIIQRTVAILDEGHLQSGKERIEVFILGQNLIPQGSEHAYIKGFGIVDTNTEVIIEEFELNKDSLETYSTFSKA